MWKEASESAGQAGCGNELNGAIYVALACPFLGIALMVIVATRLMQSRL
jgi:hypothetical protein